MRAIDYFDKGADANSERTAIVDRESRYTYREMREITRRIARAMRANGSNGEERAALYSPNDARVLICMLGILRAGAVWVPINSRNAPEANAEYMAYAEVSWLFYHSSYRKQVDELRARVPKLRHFICIDAEDGLNPSLEKFMDSGSASASEEIDWGDPYGNPDRLMGLVPTGGTTGAAKGVMVTDLAWGTMTEMASQYWAGETADRVCLTSAPLSHAAGVVAFVMTTLGATNVVMPAFDALEVLGNIERHRVTHMFLPPTALYALLDHPQLSDFDYSSLRVFLIVASPVSPDKFKKAVEVFGPCMCQSYGQTEAPMLLTWLDRETVAAAAAGEHIERLRSCGKATSAVTLAVMDEQGRILPDNTPGEIVARGSLVTPGYYKLPEATAEIRTHGWHHTGDVGYRDGDGFFYIVDRKKDMIITGGFNVYCAEVEAAVMALPQVHECAVIGVPDEKWGEAVKAIVVLRAGETLGEDAIIAHCKEKLGGVKAPNSVAFISAIPKTAAGKTDKKALRKPYWASRDRSVH
ncbi:MAG: AMP-binding protein [Candidatus Acidiferrales bacterium]|jgi:acyl-CoA synthetase (AMP-forming)/AMP-acid ligase II